MTPQRCSFTIADEGLLPEAAVPIAAMDMPWPAPSVSLQLTSTATFDQDEWAADVEADATPQHAERKHLVAAT